MKILKTFIFLALIISCAEKKTEENISEFDKILGKENVATIDYLVSDFENDFLTRQYPKLDTEKAYQQFLTDLRDDKTKNWKRISEKAIEEFESSDLRLEMYEFPDSVWIIKNSAFDKIEVDSITFFDSGVPYLKSRFKYINPDGTTDYTFSRSHIDIRPDNNYDSIIKRELKTARFIFFGKYFQALESIKDNSAFLKELYKAKDGLGQIPANLTASVMLEYNVDLNDPIIRKIIVLEIAY